MAMSEVLLVWTTTGSREEAAAIAERLVRDRLAACVQIDGPIRSVYRWQDEVESAEEWRCLIKTQQSLYPRLEATLLELHSYDVPQIVAVAADQIVGAYEQWLLESTSNSPSP